MTQTHSSLILSRIAPFSAATRHFKNSTIFAVCLFSTLAPAPARSSPQDQHQESLTASSILALAEVCHAAIGDADLDGDIDLIDLASAGTCLDASGPGISANFACRTFDADADADTDFRDIAGFLVNFTASAMGGTFPLTLGNNVLIGTPGPDLFVADLAFDATSGMMIPTLSSNDDIRGNAGIDTLTATLNFSTPTFLYPDVLSVENLEITDVGTMLTTITLPSDYEPCQTITRGSTNPMATTFRSITLVDAAIAEHDTGMTLRYFPEATFDVADVQFLRLLDTTGGIFTIETGTANGVEVLEIESNGNSNLLDGLAHVVGNTLSEIRVGGDAPLQITQPLPNTVSMVDARDSFGGLSVDVTGFTGATTTLGGPGDDTFILKGGYMPHDFVDGGDGFDTLVINAATAAGAASPQSNVANIEALAIADTLFMELDATSFGPLSKLQFRNGIRPVNPSDPILSVFANEDTVIEFNAGSDSTAEIYLHGRGTSTNGGAHSVTLALNNHDMFRLRTFLIDEVHLQSNGQLDGGPADGNVNVFFGNVFMYIGAEKKLTVTGATNLDFMGEVRVGILDASNFTGRLRLFSQPQTPNFTYGPGMILSGPGNDTLNAYGFGVVIDAGPGNDLVDGRFYGGTVTLGPGNDLYRVAGTNFGPVSSFNRITDFVPGFGGEVINIDRDDLATLEGTNNFTSENSIQEHDFPQDMTIFSQPEIVRVTSGTVPAFSNIPSENSANLLAAIGGTIHTLLVTSQHLIMVEDVAGNTGIYFAQSGFDMMVSSGELQLILILENVAVTDLVYVNFTNLN